MHVLFLMLKCKFLNKFLKTNFLNDRIDYQIAGLNIEQISMFVSQNLFLKILVHLKVTLTKDFRNFLCQF